MRVYDMKNVDDFVPSPWRKLEVQGLLHFRPFQALLPIDSCSFDDFKLRGPSQPNDNFESYDDIFRASVKSLLNLTYYTAVARIVYFTYHHVQAGLHTVLYKCCSFS